MELESPEKKAIVVERLAVELAAGPVHCRQLKRLSLEAKELHKW